MIVLMQHTYGSCSYIAGTLLGFVVPVHAISVLPCLMPAVVFILTLL